MHEAKTPVKWTQDPEERHVRAAQEYLELFASAKAVSLVIAELRLAPNIARKAKDLLRASGLPVLPSDNPHVAQDLQAIGEGQALSPVLLVRGDLERGRPLTIADGYHRLSACYQFDQNIDIQCRVVPWHGHSG